MSMVEKPGGRLRPKFGFYRKAVQKFIFCDMFLPVGGGPTQAPSFLPLHEHGKKPGLWVGGRLMPNFGF